MKRHTALLLGFSLCASLPGCAWVTAQPVPLTDTTTKGIRIAAMRPIIIISGGNVQVSMVPDNTHMFALRWGVFLAKHNFDIKFGNNGPTEIQSDADTTTIPAALIQVAEQTLKAAGTAGLLGGVSNQVGGKTSVQIFDVKIDAQGNMHLIPMLQPDTRFLELYGGSGDPGSLQVSTNPVGNGTPNPAATPAVSGPHKPTKPLPASGSPLPSQKSAP